MNSSNQDRSSVYCFNVGISFYSSCSLHTLSITDTDVIEKKEIHMDAINYPNIHLFM
jgi:hypothetical protein